MVEYNISWSGGKDSTASVILAHEHGIPVKNIYTVDIMYDENTNACPFIQDFKRECIERFKNEFGYNVITLVPNETYKQSFTHIITRSKNPNRNGKMRGGCISGMCYFTAKKQALLKGIDKSVPQIIGIAIDEPERLERIKSPDISLLAKYNMTEANAMELCKKYNMVSPLYEMGITRDGCFFCPNAHKQLPLLKELYPNIYADYYNLWYDNEPYLNCTNYIYKKSFKSVLT